MRDEMPISRKMRVVTTMVTMPVFPLNSLFIRTDIVCQIVVSGRLTLKGDNSTTGLKKLRKLSNVRLENKKVNLK